MYRAFISKRFQPPPGKDLQLWKRTKKRFRDTRNFLSCFDEAISNQFRWGVNIFLTDTPIWGRVLNGLSRRFEKIGSVQLISFRVSRNFQPRLGSGWKCFQSPFEVSRLSAAEVVLVNKVMCILVSYSRFPGVSSLIIDRASSLFDILEVDFEDA